MGTQIIADLNYLITADLSMCQKGPCTEQRPGAVPKERKIHGAVGDGLGAPEQARGSNLRLIRQLKICVDLRSPGRELSS